MKQRGSMPQILDGLIGAGNNHGIKTENKTSQRRYNRPAEEFVMIHKQSYIG